MALEASTIRLITLTLKAIKVFFYDLGMNKTILTPRWIAPVLPENVVLENHSVVIEGELIVDLLPTSQAKAKYPEATEQTLADSLLTPGLINAHTHAAMSLLRGAGDDMPLKEWLENRIWPLEGKLVSPEFVFDGTVLAAYEMLMGGITCFNDMYFFPEATARASKAMGMRVNLGIVVFEFPSAYGSGPADYLTKGLKLRDETSRDDDPASRLLSFCLAPHAPYTVSNDSFARVAMLANELGLGIHTHLHETAFEVAQSISEHGKRPIERLADLGLLGPDFVAIHGVHLSKSDIGLLSEAKASVVHCPHSNLKLASGLAPVAEILASGLNLAMGTDGSASNNRLDLMSETHTASLLSKGITGNAQAFNARQALHAMTMAGAFAVGRSSEIGSVEPGKQADLTVFDFSSIEMQPIHDAISHLIYAAHRTNVSDVWICGSHVVKKRHLAQSGAQATVSEVVARSGLWHNKVSEMLVSNP
jgi:5-methylthioadenosine/S-adenosylhomocysteine deaminase